MSSIRSSLDEKIIWMHGGLSPVLNKIEDIKTILRPTDVPEFRMLFNLLIMLLKKMKIMKMSLEKMKNFLMIRI